MFQESCAQPEVTTLHRVGALFPVEELRDLYQINMYIHWGGTRILLYCCIIVS